MYLKMYTIIEYYLLLYSAVVLHGPACSLVNPLIPKQSQGVKRISSRICRKSFFFLD